MPYSKNLGLVFVAIPKTGSTSMIRALNNIAKNNDCSFMFRSKKGKHWSALKLKNTLGDDEFQRCIKFSIVRNPWSYMLSRYLFTHVDFEPSEKEKARRGTTRSFHNLEFEDWVEAAWRKKRSRSSFSQLSKLVDSRGRLLLDHVGRLEKVQSTLDWVTDQIGVDQIEMPHVNGARPGHYAKYYNKDTQQMVRDICQEDIDYFGYDFEDA